MTVHKSHAKWANAVRKAKVGNEQERKVTQYLEEQSIKFTSTYTHKDESGSWPCYKHICSLSSKRGAETFEYSKGLAHANIYSGSFAERVSVNPVLPAELLHGLILDGSCAEDSHADFCANLGYDEDSREGLRLYLACQEAYNKLLKVLDRNQIETISDMLEDY